MEPSGFNLPLTRRQALKSAGAGFRNCAEAKPLKFAPERLVSISMKPLILAPVMARTSLLAPLLPGMTAGPELPPLRAEAAVSSRSPERCLAAP